MRATSHSLAGCRTSSWPDGVWFLDQGNKSLTTIVSVVVMADRSWKQLVRTRLDENPYAFRLLEWYSNNNLSTIKIQTKLRNESAMFAIYTQIKYICQLVKVRVIHTKKYITIILSIQICFMCQVVNYWLDKRKKSPLEIKLKSILNKLR